MFHPLIDDCKKLKDADLELKILDISKKYQMAARMGQGPVCQQLLLALDMYKDEQNRRQRENMDKMLKKQDRDLDDLINVE